MKALVDLLLLFRVVGLVAGLKCGKAGTILSMRISNGNDAEEGEWPWHGALFCRDSRNQAHQYRCGATLIGVRTVLTAAHCTMPNGIAILPKNVLVKFGLIDRHQPDLNTRSYGIERIVRHERYDPKYLHQDIAMLRTVEKVDFSEYIQPVCLPGLTQEERPISGHIVGWGESESGQLENILQHASVPVVDYPTCLRSNPMHFATVFARDEQSNFCIGGTDKITAGRGDSGGGFFQFREDSWYLQGIISTVLLPDPKNHDLVDSTQYVIATNVSSFLNWIKLVQSSWNNNLLDLAECGIDHHDISIPEAAKPTFLQYPWVTVQEFQFSQDQKLNAKCSGVLIHPRFVLIAGHCLCGSCEKFNLISVKLGDYNLSTEPDTADFHGDPLTTFSQTILVEKFVRYPASSNQSHYANDIGLLKLSHPANLTWDNVRPICIPSAPEQNPKVTVAGWKRAGKMASTVQRESVQLVDNTSCERRYGRINVDLGDPESFLCVERERKKNGTNCANFFSGTPLQYVSAVSDGNNRYYLKGLFAFGLSSCNLKFTDVYVNVSYYGWWIKKVVESESNAE